MALSRERLIEQLRCVFDKNGATQQEIAKQSGVHQSQVSRILRGEFKRLTRNVLKICKYANVAPSRLTGKDPLSPELKKVLIRLLNGPPNKEKALLRLFKAIDEL